MAVRANPILKNYRLDYVECRAFGHEWEHVKGLVDHKSYGTVKGKQSECGACGAIRYRWYLSTGRRFGANTYEPPPGYSLHLADYPNAETLPSQQEWRGLALKQMGFKTRSNVQTIKTTKRRTA